VYNTIEITLSSLGAGRTFSSAGVQSLKRASKQMTNGSKSGKSEQEDVSCLICCRTLLEWRVLQD